VGLDAGRTNMPVRGLGVVRVCIADFGAPPRSLSLAGHSRNVFGLLSMTAKSGGVFQRT